MADGVGEFKGGGIGIDGVDGERREDGLYPGGFLGGMGMGMEKVEGRVRWGWECGELLWGVLGRGKLCCWLDGGLRNLGKAEG